MDIGISGKTQLEVTHSDKLKVELARGQKGTYGWTITAYGATVDETLALLAKVDSSLKAGYTQPEPGVEIPEKTQK